MVLNEVDGRGEVRLVELVGDVPTDRSKLLPLLKSCVQEGNSVQEWFPLRHVDCFQKILGQQSIGSF